MRSIDTRNFGTVQVDESEVIRFEEGIPGFEDVKEFVVLGNESDAMFFWLQSVDESDVSMIVADPFRLHPEYAVDIEDPDITALGITDPGQLLTLCVVVIPQDIRQMRANLSAPIFINIQTNKGKQIVQDNPDLPLRFFLAKED